MFLALTSHAASFEDFFVVQDVELSEDGGITLDNFVVPGPAFNDGGFIPDVIDTDIAYQTGLTGSTVFNFSGLATSPTTVEILILGSQQAGNSAFEENAYLGQLNVNLEQDTYDGQMVLFNGPTDPIFSWVGQGLGSPASTAADRAGVVDAAALDIMVSRSADTITITHSGTAVEPDQLSFHVKYSSYLVDSLRPGNVGSAILPEGGAGDTGTFPIDATTDIIILNAFGGEQSSSSSVESIIGSQILLNRQPDGSFLASGVVQVVDGIGDARVTNWSFAGYPVPGDATTDGSGSAVFIDDIPDSGPPAGFRRVGDTAGSQSAGGGTGTDVDVTRLGPKLFFDGAGNLVVEQRPEIKNDWTMQWVAIQQERQSAPSPLINLTTASVIDTTDLVNNDLNLGGTPAASDANDPGNLRIEVPLGSSVGLFRLADSTQNDTNENRYFLEFNIDFTTNSTSGVSIGRRNNSPDFVSWAAVPFGTELADESGLAPGVDSNRTSILNFNDLHVGGVTIDLVNNPDGDGKNFITVAFRAPGNPFSFYELGGALASWSVLESARFLNLPDIATVSGGQSSPQADGSVIVPVLDLFNSSVTFTTPDNYNGSFDVVVEATNNGLLAGDVNVTAFSNRSAQFDQDSDGTGLGPVLEEMLLTPVLESDANPAGDSVQVILASSLQSGSATANVAIDNGIAITATTIDAWSQANAGIGRWQYSLDGATWNEMPPLSAANALLLDNDDLLRYLPDPDMVLANGSADSATIEFLAWDGTGTGLVAGATVNLVPTLAGGSNTIFSADGDVAVIEITAVNENPVADNDGPFTTTDVTTIAVTPLTGDSDPDLDTLTITQVDGVPITAGGAAVPVTGGTVALSADGLSLEFTPTLGFSGNSDFTYSVSDANGGTATATVLLSVTPGDTDGDGIPDFVEAITGTSSLDADSDNDGLADAAEDANQNGIVDVGETDPLNPDTDGDSINDGVESGVTAGVADPDGAGPAVGTTGSFVGDADPASTTDPLNPDTDGDGLGDGVEDANQNGSNDSPVIGGTGTSGVGETDANNSDSDGDGLSDGDEVNGSGDLAPFGATDPLDTDTDDGGALDGAEAQAGTPTDPTIGNALDDAIDTDNDGVFDAVEALLGTDPNDPDTDNDGLLDGQEAGNDGVVGPGETDPLDADSDDDGLTDGQEDANNSGSLDVGETDPLNPDTDGDGIADGVELGVPSPGIPGGLSDGQGIAFGGTANSFVGDADPNTMTDPTNVDTDGDGINDGVEDANQDGAATFTLGDSTSSGSGETDPTNVDTDSDGLSDGDEVNGTGPLTGLGVTDPLDPDTDNGGTQDGTEVLADNTDPTAGNGADDAAADPDNDGLSNAQEALLGTDPNNPDTDGDGLDDGDETENDGSVDPGDTDPLDADSDDDGLTDGTEALGPDGMPISGDETDPLLADSDADGLNDGLESGVTAPAAGGTSGGSVFAGTDIAAGNFVPDTDPTTTTDPTNPDSDSDGLLDGVEDANGDGATINTVGATGSTGSGETDPNNADTDNDSLTDGIEVNGIGPLAATGPTDPLDSDTDDGGTEDGTEVLADGADPTTGNGADDAAADPDGDGLSNGQEALLGTDPNDADSDNDGIDDGSEVGGDGVLQPGDTNPLDADSDDDGLADGAELVGQDGLPNTGDETNPTNPDSDFDGLADGTEVGVTAGLDAGATDAAGIGFSGTGAGFIADQDPSTTTDPTDADSDNDGLSDGLEDANGNGLVDTSGVIGGTGTAPGAADETDPNNADSDGDTLLDGNEINGTGPLSPFGPTDPLDTDTDDGGIPDNIEVADGANPTVGNAADDNLDTDGDGTPDDLDSSPTDSCVPDNSAATCDTDGDGVSDGDEIAQGTDPTVTDSDGDGISDADEAGDTDGDGIPDSAEIDSDNDGIADIVEIGGNPNQPLDADGDGTPDFQDSDSDNDGILDAEEALGNAPLSGVDSDGDGIDDAIDVDSTGGVDANGDGIDDDLSIIDTDGDGIADSLDRDSDDDGIPDALETNVDTDFDGVPDYRDLDSDSDGIADSTESDETSVDTDGDQVEDRFDADQTGGIDANNDGIDDSVVVTDTDADGVPDYLDLDSDNDTLPDVTENDGADVDGDTLEDTGLILSITVDTDGDGVADYRDLSSSGPGTLDITNGDPALDADGDGVIDDPADLDGDGLADGVDQSPGAFGANADTDGDGVSGLADLDTDNDGIPDAIEAPDGDFTVDTDGDGIPDYVDLDSDNDGIPDVIEASAGAVDSDGNGLVDGMIDADGNGLDDRVNAFFRPLDSDLDGVPDFLDLDSDNDGLSDVLEVSLEALDVNSDGMIDDITDLDADGWLDVADRLVNGQGVLGARLTDTDDDGVPNFRDLDSDGDGFNDDVENGDFDGNGILDNLENQNDGKLETATRGSGGAMSWEIFPLALVLGWLGWRSRNPKTRQAASLCSGLALTIFVPMLLLATPALAETDCKRPDNPALNSFQDCFYLAVGLNATHVDPENTVNGFRTTDDKSSGWKLAAGWHFKPRGFVEAAYANLGHADLSNLNPAINALVPNPEIEYKVISLMGGYWLRRSEESWNAYVKAGLSYIDNESNEPRIGFEKQTNVQFALGLGVQYQPQNSGWFFRAEFDSYDRDALLYGLSIGRYVEPRRR